MTGNPRRRDLVLALSLAPLLAVRPALAQAPYVPQPDVDYTVLANPQPTDAPGKVEVLDFFWYGCPHCYALLPDLEAWRRRQPADVAFKHVPVDFGDPSREPHTRLFCALQVLGRVDDLHVKVFDAMNQRHLRLTDADAIADFMGDNGIPRDKWLAAYNSFSVAGGVRRARIQYQSYLIDGTPTLAVDGRFLTSPTIEHTHTHAGTLAVLSYLIDHVRAERAHRHS